jgi:hypothetical protein
MYLIIATLVVLDEKLANAKLVRIHDGQEQLAANLSRQIVRVEFGGHGTPHLQQIALNNTYSGFP